MTDKTAYSPSPKLMKLREEKAEVEAKLNAAIKKDEQLEHEIRRAENRANYLKESRRKERTHRLVIKGAVIESLAPGLRDFSEKEFYELMEKIFSVPQVGTLVQNEIGLHGKQEENENG